MAAAVAIAATADDDDNFNSLIISTEYLYNFKMYFKLYFIVILVSLFTHSLSLYLALTLYISRSASLKMWYKLNNKSLLKAQIIFTTHSFTCI